MNLINFCFLDNQGFVISTGQGFIVPPMPQDAVECIEYPSNISLPSRPDNQEYWKYKYYDGIWVDTRSIEELKVDKWIEIKAARDAEEFSTFTWDNSVFDCTATSQARIQGGVQLAQIALSSSIPFSIVWTLADNSTRTLSATEMIAVGEALASKVIAAHSTARVLRNAIEAAQTKEEVSAINWQT